MKRMKRHKHAALIHAWADGAVVETLVQQGVWVIVDSPIWSELEKYRIKHEPKPDVVETYMATYIGGGIRSVRPAEHWEKDTLKLTFEGETGQLKSAEVIK